MGHWQWNSPSIFCVNVLVRPTRISQRRWSPFAGLFYPDRA